MQKFTIMVAVAGAMLCGPALAQTSTSPSQPGSGATTSNPSSFREAPIGHRQPRRDEVPVETSNPRDAVSAQDRELDRKIKGICRGC